jgi:small subunit ribosomal protein S20
VANIKSQIKRNKQNDARHERNKAVRSELKSRVKRAVAAAESGAEDTAQLASLAQKRLAKAGRRRIIHPNAAARRQSRLARRVNKASASS